MDTKIKGHSIGEIVRFHRKPQAGTEIVRVCCQLPIQIASGSFGRHSFWSQVH